MDRKTFIEKVVGPFLITLLIVAIVGCSSSDDGSGDLDAQQTPPSKCLENGALGLIATNHGHSLTIPKEDVIAAKDKTYNIQGFSEHNHTLTVTSGDFSAMKNATRLVDIYSSTDDEHRHSVVIGCAP